MYVTHTHKPEHSHEFRCLRPPILTSHTLVQLINISKMEPAGVGKLIVNFLETTGYGCTQAELDAKILETLPDMAGEIEQVRVLFVLCFCTCGGMSINV